MKCPHCSHAEDHVIDSRPVETGQVIRRRRECLGCAKRFTTYERLEVMPLIVLKSDNRREAYDRTKLREGIIRACEKRNITSEQIERLVEDIESTIQEKFVMEVPSRAIGELVLSKLKKLDGVAYIRFASVYRQFSDVGAFQEELRNLQRDLRRKDRKAAADTNGAAPAPDTRVASSLVDEKTARN